MISITLIAIDLLGNFMNRMLNLEEVYAKDKFKSGTETSQ